MIVVLLVFVLWLAINNRLGVYAALASTKATNIASSGGAATTSPSSPWSAGQLITDPKNYGVDQTKPSTSGAPGGRTAIDDFIAWGKSIVGGSSTPTGGTAP